jgi:hypothetical protein
VQLNAEQLAPALVTTHQQFDLRQGSGQEAYIISEAAGSQKAAIQGHTNLLSRGPSMEGLEQQIEQVRARRAALGKTISHGPLRPVDLAIAETLPEVKIERPEALHHGGWQACGLHNPEEGPPGKGREALGDVELHQP